MKFRLLLAALATYRLSQFLKWDIGPFRIFEKTRTLTAEWAYQAEMKNKEQGKDDTISSWENLDYAINCPYCSGVWFAIFTAILIKFPTKVGDFFLLLFGISGAQAFMQGITKQR